MKKIFIVLLVLASSLAKAQTIPANLKDSAFKYYVELMNSISHNSYDPNKDQYLTYRKRCLIYCTSRKDSTNFSTWIVDKWNDYKWVHRN